MSESLPGRGNAFNSLDMGSLLTDELNSLDGVEVFGPHETCRHDRRRPRDTSLTVNEHTARSRVHCLFSILNRFRSLVQCGLDPLDGVGQMRQDVGVRRIVDLEGQDVEMRRERESRA